VVPSAASNNANSGKQARSTSPGSIRHNAFKAAIWAANAPWW
jgi:hypothetical protein